MDGRESPRSTEPRAGFTLVEALVALLILGAALVPLFSTFADGLRAERRVDDALVAVALAEQRLAELSLLPADSIDFYAQPREGGFGEHFAGYRWRAVMETRADQPALVRAAVLIERGGREDFALETEFYYPELLPARQRMVR